MGNIFEILKPEIELLVSEAKADFKEQETKMRILVFNNLREAISNRAEFFFVDRLGFFPKIQSELYEVGLRCVPHPNELEYARSKGMTVILVDMDTIGR